MRRIHEQRRSCVMTSGKVGVVLCACGVVFLATSLLWGQKRVTFPTADEGVVVADLYGRSVHGVVLAPGARFDRASWKPQARVLAEAGFLVLAIDFRGRGESRGGTAGAEALQIDVLSAVRYMRELGVKSIALVGASLGGWAVAEAVVEAEPNEIDCVVLLAHSPIDDPAKLKGRKLFIVSRGDTRGGGVPRLVEIRNQYDRAPEPKELVVLEGSAHAQFLFQTDQAERLMQEIVRFLSAP